MSINHSTIVGNITHDLELKTTTSGSEFINFRVAVDRKFQKPGEAKKTSFIDVKAFGKTAVFVSTYFHKGKTIGVEGELIAEDYTTQSGEKRHAVYIKADNVSFVGAKQESPVQAATDDFDELPF